MSDVDRFLSGDLSAETFLEDDVEEGLMSVSIQPDEPLKSDSVLVDMDEDGVHFKKPVSELSWRALLQLVRSADRKGYVNGVDV